MSTLFLSHGHLDHLGAIGYWLSQRFLMGMGPGTLITPAAIASEVGELVALLARLEGGRPYDVHLEPVAEGHVHLLRNDLELRFFRTDHWVATLGVEMTWRRRRLHPDLAGLSQEEIVQRRLDGQEVTIDEPVLLLGYGADTGPGVLTRRPGLLAAEVLLLECSFFAASDRGRAERFGHLHVDDLIALAGQLSCRHLVLLHGSRRERLRDIEAHLASDLEPLLRCSLHHLMVDWE